MRLSWPSRRVRDAAALAIFFTLAVIGTLTATFLIRHIVAIHRLTRGTGDTVFYGADGRPWFRMDEQRRDVPLAQISPFLQDAVVAIEDHRFRHHAGIDPVALGRAIVENARARTVVEGGSTITQQLGRTLFLSNKRTYNRKIKEAILAFLLEAQLSKDQILELYLNRVYLSAGVYGVEPLSRKLFGKPARQLTLAEAALIAGLIRAPSALSPWSNHDAAVRRSHIVLRRMREERLITASQEQAGLLARPRVRPYPLANEARAGYAKDFLRQQFRNRFGGDHPPDWEVHTTFVPLAQEAAERAVTDGLRRLGVPHLQAALVVIEPSTGNLLALVGGSDFNSAPFNRATKSRRQPGSAFKPIVYAVALEQGYSPVSVLSGLAAIRPIGREEWTPRNARGDAPDELTLRAALLESNNRAAVALQQRLGTRPVIRLASDLGMPRMPNVPSLALGTGLVSPLELTTAYAVFPNGGYAVRPRAIVRVLDASGDVAHADEIRRERILSEPAAFQMVTMLADVVQRGTASGVRAAGLGGGLGGKTGTTDDFKDAWFVGFSSSVVVGVWVGFDQPRPIAQNGYGSRLALPIWIDFMRRTQRLFPARSFDPPAGLREEILCSVSYRRPVDECPTYVEYFKEGDSVPGGLCSVHQGTLRQRARRAIEGLFAGLGRKIRGIFR